MLWYDYKYRISVTAFLNDWSRRPLVNSTQYMLMVHCLWFYLNSTDSISCVDEVHFCFKNDLLFPIIFMWIDCNTLIRLLTSFYWCKHSGFSFQEITKCSRENRECVGCCSSQFVCIISQGRAAETLATEFYDIPSIVLNLAKVEPFCKQFLKGFCGHSGPYSTLDTVEGDRICRKSPQEKDLNLGQPHEGLRALYMGRPH